MELHDFDDLPFHQHPAPFHMLATSDPHFNDGYFFACYARGWYLFAGLRLHPNTNTIDGFASITHDGEQRCVRVSRALRPRYTDLAVGPLSLDITELMERHRIVLAENDAGFNFDVTWQVQAPAFAEARYQHVKYGRIINDVLRYTQVCRATGMAHYDGQPLEIDSWHAMRDHSWGLRASMGPPTRFGGLDGGARKDPRAFRLWVPFEAGDHCGFINTHEDQAGETLDFEGSLHFADGRSVELRSVEHEIQYRSGLPVGATMDLLDEEGVVRHYELELAGTPADVQGMGYYGGWLDRGSAGVYRGEKIEVDRYPSGVGEKRTGPPHVPVDKRPGATEFPFVITGPDGGHGMAHFEHTILGGTSVTSASRPDAGAVPNAPS